MSWQRWTKEEDDVLLKHYRVGGTAAVSLLLPHRGRSSIVYRANRLGLHVSPSMRSALRLTGKPRFESLSRDIAMWFARYLLSGRPHVPTVEQCIERWDMSRAAAYRWRTWACDELEKIQNSSMESTQ
jgi:hypothetical protein